MMESNPTEMTQDRLKARFKNITVWRKGGHRTNGFDEWLMAYHGKELKPPQRPVYYPEADFVTWHVNEVFQGDGRHEW